MAPKKGIATQKREEAIVMGGAQHPEVRKVYQFEEWIENERLLDAQERERYQNGKKRMFAEIGHNLCLPDGVFGAGCMCLGGELISMAVENSLPVEKLVHDDNEGIIGGENRADDDEYVPGPLDGIFVSPGTLAGPTASIHKTLLHISIKLAEKEEYLWVTLCRLIRMTHRRDKELYRIVYLTILKEVLDDLIAHTAHNAGVSLPVRTYAWMSCSP